MILSGYSAVIMELTQNHRGKVWIPEVFIIKEDLKLKELIRNHGLRNWKKISCDLQISFNIIKSPKQCRDRWFNSLKTEKFPSTFSKEEEKRIFHYFLEIGPKWSCLSNIIQTKSENQIKNFINATMRRNVRRFNLKKNQDQKIACFSLRLFHIEEIRDILVADKETKKEWFYKRTLNDSAKQKIEEIFRETRRSRENIDENGFLISQLDSVLDEAIRNRELDIIYD